MKKEIIKHHFPLIDSTNVWLKEHIDEIKENSVVLVTADEQSAGRGRQGRSWLSPKGNFYGSIGFYSHKSDLLSLMAAVVVAQVLESVGLQPKLKWPNDIMVSGKKIGGILCEVKDHAAIVGIGINVSINDKALEALGRPATSIFIESGNVPSNLGDKILDLFLKGLEMNKEQILAEYRNRLYHIEGDRISFNGANGRVDGYFAGVDDNGFLKVKVVNSLLLYSSGEIN